MLYFTWNGTDSRNKHVRVQNRIPIIRPEERVKHVTIPGRSGELTQTEGDQIYNSYIQSVEIGVDGAENVPEAENWLKGEGMVSFHAQPDLEQKARIIGAVTLAKHSRNVDRWKGTVQFYCEPTKRSVNEQAVTVTVSGSSLNNPGDMTAFPRIEITGSGLITVRAGGKTLTIPQCVSGWIIDSENEWILQGSTPQEGACSGEFPVLVKGANTVTFTGSVTKLLITPNFRYL